MQTLKEIYQKSIIQQQQSWRTCRIFDAAQVYHDFIKRLSIAVFPEELILNEEFKNIIGQITLWYANDNRFKLDISKGIILRGNCGTGKTIILETIVNIVEFGDNRKPIFINVRDLQNLYIKNDIEQIETLKKRFLILIDDVGVENVDIKNYGNLLEPFNDLFDYRYRNKLETIISTNLTPEKIKQIYGDRILDRFKECFNEYIFDFKSLRK